MTLENVSTIEKNDLKKKAVDKQKKKNINIRIYHSFLTIVLFLCILQLSWSALLNISKIVMFQGKINKSVEIKNQAQEKYNYLSQKTKTNNPMEQAEIIARNNLKMAANDEVLILISQAQDEEIEEAKTLKDKIMLFFKNQHHETLN